MPFKYNLQMIIVISRCRIKRGNINPFPIISVYYIVNQKLIHCKILDAGWFLQFWDKEINIKVNDNSW